MKVVITGSTGFLGNHLIPILKQHYKTNEIVGLSSSDYDLTIFNQAVQMVKELNPQILIHLAALSGGIGINKKLPANFYFINTLLTANVFEAAARNGVQKLIYTMGGCSYPNDATSPISEDQMWLGFPHPDSAGYSCAKKMGIVAGECYRKQYGMKSVILVPGNMYGEYDNYDQSASHVIPALIRRFYEAKMNSIQSVSLWGDGKPFRDFVYAGDVARTFPYFIKNDSEFGPINISSGTKTRISDLAEMISKLSGYTGELKWDTSKPGGQLVKIFDVQKLNSLGLTCDTPLEKGLQRTIEWFQLNYNKPGAIRL